MAGREQGSRTDDHRHLLSIMLTAPTTTQITARHVHPTAFHDLNQRRIFTTMINMAQNGEPANPTTITQKLPGLHTLIHELATTPPPTGIEALTDRLTRNA